MISSIEAQQSNQIGQELYQLISKLWLEIAIQKIVGLITTVSSEIISVQIFVAFCTTAALSCSICDHEVLRH